jgi:phosphoribosylformylglycinamidine (FGAM) synthase PurS component
MIRIEHNAETGEIKEIKLTAEEIEVIEAERLTNPVIESTPVTIEQKLASVGLSVDDLKSALGI